MCSSRIVVTCASTEPVFTRPPGLSRVENPQADWLHCAALVSADTTVLTLETLSLRCTKDRARAMNMDAQSYAKY